MLHDESVIKSVDDIALYYRTLNPEKNLYIGIEWERHGVYRDDLSPVPYASNNGYLAIYIKLTEEVGWEILKNDENNIYELQRGEAKITTEGDGRPELSGSPQISLHDLAREFRLHNNEIIEMGNVFNIAWLPVSWQPLHKDKEIELIPKYRYKVYVEKGWESTAKRNNGLTVNCSFTDEDNMISKLQTMFRITPIVAAMFASSPFSEGKLSQYFDNRRVKLMEQPEQFLGPQNILDEDFCINKWIDYYINKEVVFVFQDGKETAPKQPFTFLEWIEKGYNNTKPTLLDFDQHIRTHWADFRLRPSYIECRIAGSVPYRLAMSLPALMKGILFSSDGWSAVEELTKDWTFEDVQELDKQSWKTGLQTEYKGKKLLTYAQELITIANENLHRFKRTDAQEEDEAIYLAPLKEQIFIKEKSPAEELVDLYEGEWNGDISRIVEWCERE